MKLLLNIFLYLIIGNSSFSQIVIQMKREGGVSIIPCKVNDLKLSFIFDTGASDVSLSLAEALFMLKNGYLQKEDIVGTGKYADAKGEISEGYIINLREIEIGGLKLKNIKASIVKNMEAPLLFGQSAIAKLGKIELDLTTNQLTIINEVDSIKSVECKDINGQAYKTVTIGTQIWMAENLNVNRFRNGDQISMAESNNDWINVGKEGRPGWCFYENYSSNGRKYGKLYNFYAINDPRGLAPKGWHIPSDEEWTILINFLGGENIAGVKMKSTAGWKDKKGKSEGYFFSDSTVKFDTYNGTNESGFSANSSGMRSNLGFFWGGDSPIESSNCEWWSVTENEPYLVKIQSLMYNSYKILKSSYPRIFGLSVRCIKDQMK